MHKHNSFGWSRSLSPARIPASAWRRKVKLDGQGRLCRCSRQLKISCTWQLLSVKEYLAEKQILPWFSIAWIRLIIFRWGTIFEAQSKMFPTSFWSHLSHYTPYVRLIFVEKGNPAFLDSKMWWRSRGIWKILTFVKSSIAFKLKILGKIHCSPCHDFENPQVPLRWPKTERQILKHR